MNKNIPKRRFKGFNENWEVKSLKVLGYTYNSLSGMTKDDFDKGTSKYITYLNVFHNSITRIDELEKVRVNKKQNKVLNGDIFFTTSSETPEEVGMTSVWTHNLDNVYLNSFCFGYRFYEKTNPYFIANLFRSSGFRKEIELLAQGISRFNISKQRVMDLSIAYPSDNEQKQIGEFFQKLDNMIELQSKKVNKYEMLKESYLEKLYIRSKNKKPDLYFDQFSNNLIYENGIIDSYIDKITDFVAAGSFAAMAENVKYLSKPSFAQLVRTTDLKNNFKNNGFVYVNEHAFNFLSHVNLDKKTIVLPNVGNCGEVYLSDPKKLPYKRNVLGPNSIYVYTDKLDLEYLYYYFNTKTFQKKLKLIISPSGQSKFNKTDFKNIDIRVSANLEEQKVIGCFFSKLDNIIELQNEKLDKLKNLKKAYLNEVFVN